MSRNTEDSSPIRTFPAGPVVLLLVGAIGLGTSVVGGQDEGHKRTDEHVKKIENTIKEIAETRKQVQKSLDAYSSMLQDEVGNRRSAYKNLVKALDQSEKKSEEVQKRTKEMEKEAKEFFKQWSKSLKSIQNDDLRRRSQQRLEDTRDQFDKLVEAEKQARGHFDLVITNLRDQVVYLEHDLNSSSAASLKEDEAKILDMTVKLFENMDEFAIMAKDYIHSLQPK